MQNEQVKSVSPVDLFACSLVGLLPHCRPCEDTLENSASRFSNSRMSTSELLLVG